MSAELVPKSASRWLAGSVIAMNFAAVLGLLVIGGKAVNYQSSIPVSPVVAALCTELTDVMAAGLVDENTEDALRRHVRARAGTNGYNVHLDGVAIWVSEPRAAHAGPFARLNGQVRNSTNCARVQ